MTDPRQIALEEKRRRAMIIAQDVFDAAMQAPRRRFDADILPFKRTFQTAQTALEATRQAAFEDAEKEFADGMRLLVADQKTGSELLCRHCGWVGTPCGLFQIAVGEETVAVCPICRKLRSTVEREQ